MKISFDRAYEIMTSSASRLGCEQVELDCALGRILAQDIISDRPVPPFNKSAMDGFACRRADLENELAVIEAIPAGYMPKKTIGPNQCAKIMTGAVIPEGADCVIMVEYTEKTAADKIRFTAARTSDNICPEGEDIKKGAVVLRIGTVLKPQHIAVLASVGCVKPLVTLQPKVGILATGNELVEASEKPSPCQIRNSNGPQLTAHTRAIGALATNYGIGRDTKKAINKKVKKALAENDVVVLSGGVSVGEYDLVREVLKENNINLLFEKVAIKPGKPMVFGILEASKWKARYVLGLPGNPVSTFVCFELLVKPFLNKMAGCAFKPVVSYRKLDKTIKRKKTERDSWLPVIFKDDNKVAAIEYHGSAHINALCEADGLICIPTGRLEIKEGTFIAVRQI